MLRISVQNHMSQFSDSKLLAEHNFFKNLLSGVLFTGRSDGVTGFQSFPPTPLRDRGPSKWQRLITG